MSSEQTEAHPPAEILQSIKQGEGKDHLKHVETKDHTGKERAYVLEAIEKGKKELHHTEPKEPKLPTKEDIEEERRLSQSEK